ncbi:YDG domain-containing protein [uncultured Oscillibacter sp.]|uniref:YDG domain-containing protein n=1 Tax=uncultured Oscillibacter sp. TaxID=876091 RepID=UPI0025FDDC7F|nr:YDG domain-containing protein [uncultured Oscillibacter sp.]
MKRRILSVLLVLALVLPLLPLPAAAAGFSGGKGTLEDPYLIKTAADLQAVASETGANVHYRLENGIDMNGSSTGIGTFTGTLDGNGCTITGLNGCLVKSLASGAVIRDLTIASSTIAAPQLPPDASAKGQREILVRGDLPTYQNYLSKNTSDSNSTRFLPANLGFAAGENYGTLDNITVENSTINGYYENNKYSWSNQDSNVEPRYYNLANYAPGNLGGVAGLNGQGGRVLNCTVQALTVVSDNAAGIIGGVAGRSSGTVLGSIVTGMKIEPKSEFRKWSAPLKSGEDGGYDYENCTEAVPYTWAVGGAVGLYDRTLSHAACSYTNDNTGNYNNGGAVPAIGYTVLEPDNATLKGYTCNNVNSFDDAAWNGWLKAAGPDGKSYESLGLREREADMTVKAGTSAGGQVQVTLLDDNGNLLRTETFDKGHVYTVQRAEQCEWKDNYQYKTYVDRFKVTQNGTTNGAIPGDTITLDTSAEIRWANPAIPYLAVIPAEGKTATQQGTAFDWQLAAVADNESKRCPIGELYSGAELEALRGKVSVTYQTAGGTAADTVGPEDYGNYKVTFTVSDTEELKSRWVVEKNCHLWNIGPLNNKTNEKQATLANPVSGYTGQPVAAQIPLLEGFTGGYKIVYKTGGMETETAPSKKGVYGVYVKNLGANLTGETYGQCWAATESAYIGEMTISSDSGLSIFTDGSSTPSTDKDFALTYMADGKENTVRIGSGAFIPTAGISGEVKLTYRDSLVKTWESFNPEQDVSIHLYTVTALGVTDQAASGNRGLLSDARQAYPVSGGGQEFPGVLTYWVEPGVTLGAAFEKTTSLTAGQMTFKGWVDPAAPETVYSADTQITGPMQIAAKYDAGKDTTGFTVGELYYFADESYPLPNTAVNGKNPIRDSAEHFTGYYGGTVLSSTGSADASSAAALHSLFLAPSGLFRINTFNAKLSDYLSHGVLSENGYKAGHGTVRLPENGGEKSGWSTGRTESFWAARPWNERTQLFLNLGSKKGGIAPDANGRATRELGLYRTGSGAFNWNTADGYLWAENPTQSNRSGMVRPVYELNSGVTADNFRVVDVVLAEGARWYYSPLNQNYAEYNDSTVENSSVSGGTVHYVLSKDGIFTAPAITTADPTAKRANIGEGSVWTADGSVYVWKGSDGKTYQAGATVPAGVVSLTMTAASLPYLTAADCTAAGIPTSYEGYYAVRTPADLTALQAHIAAVTTGSITINVVLLADITAPKGFAALGGSNGAAFLGTFDGRGHTISGLSGDLIRTLGGTSAVRDLTVSGGGLFAAGAANSTLTVVNCLRTDNGTLIGSAADTSVLTVSNCGSRGALVGMLKLDQGYAKKFEHCYSADKLFQTVSLDMTTGGDTSQKHRNSLTVFDSYQTGDDLVNNSSFPNVKLEKVTAGQLSGGGTAWTLNQSATTEGWTLWAQQDGIPVFALDGRRQAYRVEFGAKSGVYAYSDAEGHVTVPAEQSSQVWSFQQEGESKVTLDENTVIPGDITLTSESASADVTVTVKTDPTYGDTWGEILTLSESTGCRIQIRPAGGGAYADMAADSLPDAGDYEYRVLNGNGALVKDSAGTVTVAKKTVTAKAEVPGGEDGFEYTGVGITPEVTVTIDGGAALVRDTDYTVAYTNNTKVGTATATVSPASGSNYTFAAVKVTFTIKKAAGKLQFDDGSKALTVTYGETVTVKLNAPGVGEGEEVIFWVRSADYPKGMAMLTASSDAVTATVSGGTVTAAIPVDRYTYLYDASTLWLYAVIDKNGNTDRIVSDEIQVTVQPKDVRVVLSPRSRCYDGTTGWPIESGTIASEDQTTDAGTLRLFSDVGVDVTRLTAKADSPEVGADRKVTVSGPLKLTFLSGNTAYPQWLPSLFHVTGILNGTENTFPAVITKQILSVTLPQTVYVKPNTAQTVEVDLSEILTRAGAEILSVDPDTGNKITAARQHSGSTVSFTTRAVAAGTAETLKVMLKEGTNCQGGSKVFIRIEAAEKTSDTTTLRAVMNDYACGETAPAPVLSGVKNIDMDKVTYRYESRGATSLWSGKTAPSAVGTYTVTVTYDAGSVVYTATADFAVTAAVLTEETVTAGTLTYRDGLQAAPVTVEKNGAALTLGTDYLLTVEAASEHAAAWGSSVRNAGTYRFTVVGKGNYSGRVTGTFTVAQAEDPNFKRIKNRTWTVTYAPGLTLAGVPTEDPTCRWQNPAQEVGNAGDKAFAMIYTPADAVNYKTETFEANLTVEKAKYGLPTDLSVYVKPGATGAVDLTQCIAAGAQLGTPAVRTGGSDILAKYQLNGTELTYTVKTNAAVYDSATVEIPVTSENYEEVKIAVTFSVTNLPIADIEFMVDHIEVQYGDTVSIRQYIKEDTVHDRNLFYSTVGRNGPLTETGGGDQFRAAGIGQGYVEVYTYRTDAYAACRVYLPVTVTPRALTITGVTAAARSYEPGNRSVTLLGGALSGVLSEDKAEVGFTLNGGTMTDANAGEGKPVTPDITLTGAKAGNYTLTLPTDLTVDIRKLDPEYTVPDPMTASYGQTLSELTLPAGWSWVEDGGTSVGGLGPQTHRARFTPADTVNYNTVEISLTVTVRQNTPTAADLTVTGLTNAEYDGRTHPVTATPKRDGMGTVTVRYNGSLDAPKNAGSYAVTAELSGGSNYAAASIPLGKLEISRADAANLPCESPDQSVIVNVGAFSDPVVRGRENETLDGSFTYTYGSVTGKSHEEAEEMLRGMAANKTVTLAFTFTPAGPNYTGAKTGSFTVTVKDIEFMVNGEAASADNAILDRTGTEYGSTWAERISVREELTASVGGAVKTGAYTVVPDSGSLTDRPGVGSHGYTVKFTGSGYTDVTVFSGTITVTPRTVTVTGIAAQSRPYNGGTAAALDFSGASITGKLEGDELSVTASGVFETKNAGESRTVSLTGLTLTGGAKDNYTLDAANSQRTASADITPKEVTVTADNCKVSKVYDGTNRAGAFIGAPQLTGVLSGDSVTVSAAPAAYTDVNVGGQTSVEVRITLAGTDMGNYRLAGGTLTVPCEITPAPHGGETASGSAKYGESGTVDLSGLIVSGGTASIQSKTDGSSVLTGEPELSGGTLRFAFADDGAKAGETAEVVVQVVSGNYKPYTVTVTLTVSSRSVPVVTAPRANALTYSGAEQTLITAGTTTGGKLLYSLTSGGNYTAALPTAKNAGEYTVYYKVIGDGAFADVPENHVTVTIARKAAAVAPKNVSISAGSAVPAFELAFTGLVNGEKLTPSEKPVFVCYESGTKAVSSSTPAGTYSIVWTNRGMTFSGEENYDLTRTETGVLTVTAKSGGSTGGGGGSSSGGGSVSVPTVPTTPAKPEAPAFSDVSTGAYYHDAVKWAAEKGITGGTGDGKFSPNRPCTRAQIVTFLWRAAGSPEPQGAAGFADISADAYYAKAVAWAVENGVTSGTEDGRFRPDQPCTRAQSVAFLYRAAGAPAVSGGSGFDDVAESAYYAAAVAWAQANGVTGGLGNGLFGPGNGCTRAQIVTFLYRAYQGK